MSTLSSVLGGQALTDLATASLGDDVVTPERGSAILICKSGGNAWVVAPNDAEITTSWYCREDAITIAQNSTGTYGWFIPSILQTANPMYVCRQYWGYPTTCYWSNDIYSGCCAQTRMMSNCCTCFILMCTYLSTRALKCIKY